MQPEKETADTLEGRLCRRAAASGIVIAPERLRDIVDGAQRLQDGMRTVREFLAASARAEHS